MSLFALSKEFAPHPSFFAEAKKEEKAIANLFSNVKKFNFSNQNLNDIDSLAQEVLKNYKISDNAHDKCVLHGFLKNAVELDTKYSSFFRKVFCLFCFVFGIETKDISILKEITDEQNKYYKSLYKNINEPYFEFEEFAALCDALHQKSMQSPNEIFTYRLMTIGSGSTKKCYLELWVENSKFDFYAISDVEKNPINENKEVREKKIDQETRVANIFHEKQNDSIVCAISYENVTIDNQEIIRFISPYCNKGELLSFFPTIFSMSYQKREKLFFQLVCGLDILHTAGIWHLDIKPPNILVHIESDGSIRLKITDFDLCCFSDSDSTEKSKLRGTPLYTDIDYVNSNLSKKDRIDLEDVWGTGLVGYQLLNKALELPWAKEKNAKNPYPQVKYMQTNWSWFGKTEETSQFIVRDNMLCNYKERLDIHSIKKKMAMNVTDIEDSVIL